MLTHLHTCSLFLDKEEDNVIRLSSLEDEAQTAETPEQLHAVYKRFVNFHGELLLMVHWSILAYTGLVKILKKHHKRTGLLVRAPHLDNLLSQPFCSIEVSFPLHDLTYTNVLLPVAAYHTEGNITWILCFLLSTLHVQAHAVYTAVCMPAVDVPAGMCRASACQLTIGYTTKQ